MPSDVIDLRDFYQTSLGQVARQMIRRAIRRMWPDLRGQRLLGVGYATPFLSAISAETERSAALMPAALGVLGWPADGRNLVALADEGELPFADYSIDRVLLVHALEMSHDAEAEFGEGEPPFGQGWARWTRLPQKRLRVEPGPKRQVGELPSRRRMTHRRSSPRKPLAADEDRPRQPVNRRMPVHRAEQQPTQERADDADDDVADDPESAAHDRQQ